MNLRKVAVAGGSGGLGKLIVRELTALGVEVVVLTRQRSNQGVNLYSSNNVREVNYESIQDLTEKLSDIDVVVSALAGLRPSIVEAQGRLIQAAAMAGVGKFIPSDFAIDFRRIPYGDNRNLNLRREFFEKYDSVGIPKTSVLNGAFTDMLTGTAPFILFGLNRVLCWGDPKQKMDWTTMADTARYTAYAAIDDKSPRFLKIAADQISAEDLCHLMTELTGTTYRVFRPAGLSSFKKLIQITKFFVPGGQDVYPPWQGMQYMHNMYSGIAKFDTVDNDRYPVTFQSAKSILESHLKGQGKVN